MANYTIIGGDGKEYGPVLGEDLRKWIAEGRLNAQSLAKAESDAESRPLSAFPEFADAFAPQTIAPFVRPAPAAAPPTSAKTSSLAVTSLTLGILGVFACTTALLGLILGIVAIVKVKNSRGALRGGGLALAGIIISALFLCINPIYFAAKLLPANLALVAVNIQKWAFGIFAISIAIFIVGFILLFIVSLPTSLIWLISLPIRLVICLITGKPFEFQWWWEGWTYGEGSGRYDSQGRSPGNPHYGHSHPTIQDGHGH